MARWWRCVPDAVRPLALAVACAGLVACGDAAPPEVVVTVTATPSGAPPPATPDATTSSANSVPAPTSDVEGRRFDFGMVTGTERAGDVDVLVLDRWTDPSVERRGTRRAGSAGRALEVLGPFRQPERPKTFDIPVREGTTFVLHHCVAAGEPLQTRPVGATEPPTRRTRTGSARPARRRGLGHRRRVLRRLLTGPAACGRLTGVTSEPGQRSIDVGMGAGGPRPPTWAQHRAAAPGDHGVLRLRVVLDGERIVTAEPVIGYMHRGAEKLFEVRDYRQITVLPTGTTGSRTPATSRGGALGVEAMLGMEVPERAGGCAPSSPSLTGALRT